MPHQTVIEREQKRQTAPVRIAPRPSVATATRVAVSVELGVLEDHRRYCTTIDLVDVDAESGSVLDRVTVRPPTRRAQDLPQWLARFRPDAVVLDHATPLERALYAREGIAVVVPADRDDSETIAARYVARTVGTVA